MITEKQTPKHTFKSFITLTTGILAIALSTFFLWFGFQTYVPCFVALSTVMLAIALIMFFIFCILQLS